MNPIIELYQEDITQLGPPLSVSLILVKRNKKLSKKIFKISFKPCEYSPNYTYNDCIDKENVCLEN